MPCGVLNKYHAFFFWGDFEGSNGVAWIKWEAVCKPKEIGGLGLRDWGCFNKALLGKWRWRILVEPDSLWVKILRAKYRIPTHLDKFTVEAKASNWWKDVCKACYEDDGRGWFEQGMKRVVGDGREVRFWKDCRNVPDSPENSAHSEEKGGSTGVEDEDDDGAVYEKNILDLTEDDIMGMKFDFEEDAIKFYERYGQCYGFWVRKDNVYRGSQGSIVTRQLVCSKEGVRHRKYLEWRDRVRVAKGITRVSCPARFRVRFERNSCKWKVIYFVKTQNHVLAPVDKVHLISSYRHLNDSDKAQINSLKLHGVRTCNIMGLMLGQKGGHEALGFTKKDLFNHIDKEKQIRVGNGDAVAALSYFQAKAEGDPMFFSKYTKTEDENLKDLFWSDGVSRVDYHAFGDVMAFDSTYKRNKYNKPLVIFCGYNHHGQTTVFACALITDESIQTYKWVLETFVECMFEKHPKAVVTDGDLAMKEAIRVVFPNARHKLCSWHIQQKALEKLENPDFLEDFKVLIYGNFNAERFEHLWAKVMEKYGFGNNEWITGMYGMKTMWASAYMRDKFFADFIHNFERVVREYRHNELVADFNTMYSEPLPTTPLGYIERGFSQHLTRSMFNEVKTQIEYVGDLNIIQRTEVNGVVMVKMNKALCVIVVTLIILESLVLT
ncbi:protein FAR1-RELATED SEQUENCE 5-like [Lotus japonicus]|uniref:protein FAR1-RELATED SEQUENCE 5-like n=1 Tax=Lotus japonicus TaxID=34305 RepID=UPI00258440B3|nr:protein FAR1-RELATED SEQUENCE 5-like [Lotus japonicus]